MPWRHWAAAALTLLGTPAAAQDCAPLTRLASLELTSGTEMRETYVPVTVQGVPKLMLLDTGGAMTEITTEAAAELHLARRRGNFRLYDMYGGYSDQFAEGSLEVTPLRADAVALAIAPGQHVFGDDLGIAGILAPDILKHYDIELDFGGQRINLFDPDHCAGKVVYWQPRTIAVVPMRVLHSGHIIVPVMLDGQPVTAILDTGAYHTTLTRLVAESVFGLKLGSTDTPATGHLGDKPNAITYRHRFDSLAFDGVAVENLQVDIIPDLMHQVIVDAAAPPTGSRLGDPRKQEGDVGMLIGMNILRHFHIYIAYKDEKLYVSPAEQVPAAPPPVADAPSPLHFQLRAAAR